MFSNINEQDLIEEFKTLLRNGNPQPEPQHSNFKKYLASLSFEKNNDLEAIVDLINAQGIQIKNDIALTQYENQLSSEEFKQAKAPVLKLQDLNDIENVTQLTQMLAELPSEWTIIQITSNFNPNQVIRINQKSFPDDTSMHITKFACGDLSKRLPPYSRSIKARSESSLSVIEPLIELIKMRKDVFRNPNNRKLLEKFYTTDAILGTFISDCEKYWLKGLKCLLTGRLEDKLLEADACSKVNQIITNFLAKTGRSCKNLASAVQKDIVYQITLNAHRMSNKEMLTLLNNTLGFDPGDNSALRLVDKLKELNLSNSCSLKRADKCPVILIIDNVWELVPWEMLAGLLGQPVTRILSFHMLYALFKHHEKYIVNGYRMLSIDSAFCLVNPSSDLKDCQQRLSKFLSEKLPWVEVEAGSVPDPKHLVSSLTNNHLYVYCGHGSGTHYFHTEDLKLSLIHGMVLLCGCSSALPQSGGGRSPYQNQTYTYICCGCPCLMGCLYDITSTDADIVCIQLLSSITPTVSKKGEEVTINSPKELDILKAFVASKLSAERLWSRSCFVMRGIPCKTVFTEIEREKILQKTSK